MTRNRRPPQTGYYPLVSRAVRSVSAVATRRRAPHLAATLGIVLLLGWATWPVIAGRLPENLDLLLQFAPNATFLQREVTAGRLPLWNPYVGAGVPFLADPGTAGWYLPNWIALLALSTADAVRLLLIAHLAWAAAGMYWCARRALRTGTAGAFVAAAVYAGGPFATGGLAGTLPAPLATAWLPWVLLAWHRCLDRPETSGQGPRTPRATARRCVVVAVLLVVQLSAGWPPGSALTILVLAAMGLWRLTRDPWPVAGSRWPVRAALAVAKHQIAVGLLAAVLTALLSAFLVVPALEFIAQTYYAESRTLAEAARADYVTVLSVFGAAGGTGEQESNQFYSSVVVLGLALVGALAPRDRRVLSAGLLLGTVLVWCLGMGPRFPLFGLLYEWLPGFQVIHVPSRCALLVVCGLALLAGRGMDRATSVTWRVAALASAAPALMGLLALAQLWWSDGYDPFRRLLTNVGRFAGGPYLTHVQEAHLVGFGLAAALLWLVASGPWTRFARLRRRPVSFSVFSVAKNLPLALAVLVALDLLVWHGHQRLPMVQPESWLPPPRPAVPLGDPAYRVLGFAVHGDSHFLNAFPQHVRTAQLPPNMPGLVGLRDAQAYGPLLLRRYTAYAAAANGAEPDTHWGLFTDLRSPLLDHLAVRWVLSAAPRWQVYGQPYVIERALPTDGRPVVLVQPADRPPARVVRLVTFLGEATAVRDNTPVAEVEVVGRPVAAAAGVPVRHAAILRAGVDTAEWAYGHPDVATTVQHRQAPVVRRTRLLSVEAGAVEVFQYVATLRLPDALRIERIVARALPTGTRAMVHVEAVWLDEEGDTPRPVAAGRATQGVQVYERADSLPRARWVPAAQPVPDSDAALAGVRTAGDDRRMTALIEAPPAPVAAVSGSAAAAGSAAEAAVQWHQDSPTRIVLRVNAPAAGWLVLADAFYPGWEAHVDGQPTPIYAADGLFRAVAVPPGPHEVTFDFRPRSLRLGGALAAVGVVLAAAALWLAGRGRKPLTTDH